MPLPRSRPCQALLLLVVAVATRMWLFGDPVIHSDEQFYLLVGDRMLQGAWPFVDVFDRKPVGLFLIFAGIRAVGGDGVIGYQVAATLVAAATAFLVTRLASRFAGPAASLAAGLFYLVWLLVYDGAGGQSAVWQNLPMAAAALPALDAIRSGGERLTRRGAIAMLLVGCAMQVKYVALFEGVFFGSMLLATGWKAGRPLSRVAADGALWAALALLPTAAAWAVYAAAGHGQAFLFANFLSIFGQRDDDTMGSGALKLVAGIALALPLLALGWWGRRRSGAAGKWVVAALAAIAAMGTFEQLYFLPLVLPLSVAAAGGLARSGRQRAWRQFAATIVFGAVAAALLTGGRIARRGDAAGIDRLVALVGQRPPGCLFAYGSEPILYYLTHSCLPTPYAFRSHLSQTREVRGLPIDPVIETARVLAGRPGVIVVRAARSNDNPAARQLVEETIAAGYRRVGVVTLGRSGHIVYKPR